MRWATKLVVLLGIGFVAPGSLMYAQSDKTAFTSARPVPQAATEEEVSQLRQEVAELKAIVQQLVQTSSKIVPNEAHLAHANFVVDSARPDTVASPA